MGIGAAFTPGPGAGATPAHTRPMTPVVLWTLAAVVVAAAVLVASAAVTGVRPVRPKEVLATVRAGLDRPRELLADVRLDHDDAADDGAPADLFAIGVPERRGYVEPGELTGALARVRHPRAR